ncbi:hypothetical protein pb186bvf_004496 [Paramecium bursaria]
MLILLHNSVRENQDSKRLEFHQEMVLLQFENIYNHNKSIYLFQLYIDYRSASLFEIKIQ